MHSLLVPRSHLVIGAFALLFVIPHAASGQEPVLGARRLALADAIAAAESQSPELRLATADVEAARARVVTAATRPNPTLALDREQLGGGQEDGYHETILSVSRTLDISGARGARLDAAQAGVLSAQARLAAERALVIAAVRRTYVRAASLEGRLSLLGETAEAYREAVRAAEVRLREGDISDYEVQRLRTEVARYEALLLDARLALADAGRSLARLTGADPGSVVLPGEPIGRLVLSGALSLDSAVARSRTRADVRAAEAEVGAARTELEARRRTARPNPTLILGAKEQAGGARGVVAGVSIPLPISDRGRGPALEAESLARRAEIRRDIVARDAEAQVRAAWERRQALAERIATRERLSLQTAALLRAARVAYAEGEMTLVALLDAVEAHRAAREAADTLLADLLTSAADLDAAAGGYDR